MRLTGRLTAGLGTAGGFTQLEWVRRQLINSGGIDPHPGTVNLVVDADDLKRLRSTDGWVLEPADGFCSARCHAVRVGGVPAIAVFPDVPGYPQDKLELIAALPVREHLALAEGSRVEVECCAPWRVQAVLFDIDGTLVDSLPAYFEIAKLAAAPHGITVTREQVHHSLSTGSNFWKGVLGVQDEETRRTLMEFTKREWPRILREHSRLFDGLAPVLDELKSRGLRLGIVSGARADVLELLEPIIERFDTVVLAGDVTKRKPHPEGIEKALAALDVPASDAIYVGDSDVDMQAGRNAGVATVGVLTGAASSAMLSRCTPDRLIARLDGLVRLLA